MLKSQGMRRWAGDAQLWCPVGADKSPQHSHKKGQLARWGKRVIWVNLITPRENKLISLIFSSNNWDRNCTIVFFQPEGKRSTRCDERQERLFWTGCIFQTDFIKCNHQLFFIFIFCLSSFCKTKVDLGWCKTETCLFPPFKAKTTLYPQPKSFLPLLTLGFFPPTRQKNRWMKSLYKGFQKCSCNPPMSFSKTRKKALNLFVNVPREPLPGTSRHKVGVMASHRLYAELFWRFTQWTSATASVRTYTLPLCDVELMLVEAFATL